VCVCVCVCVIVCARVCACPCMCVGTCVVASCRGVGEWVWDDEAAVKMESKLVAGDDGWTRPTVESRIAAMGIGRG